LDLLESHSATNGRQNQTVIAVLDHVDPAARTTLEHALGEHAETTRLEVMDRGTYNTIRRLIEAGVLALDAKGARILHRSPALVHHQGDARNRRLAEARRRFAEAERKQRMAGVLADGGFPVEAMAPFREAMELVLRALAYFLGEKDSEAAAPLIGFVESRLVPEGLVPAETPWLLTQLRECANETGEDHALLLYETGRTVLDHAAEALDRAALSG
jgi:hypothetical protein